MARVASIVKGVRNHWKKSAFGAAAVTYGISYAYEKYEIHQVMRIYCTEATEYGNVTGPVSMRPKNVTVILNPTANKRSATKAFEEYCAPILHLAGIAIDIVQTDSEGHARRYIEELDILPDAILVAGGDGTFSEAITGLLRRKQYQDCPIGLLPVGRTNTVGQQLFGYTRLSNLEEVQSLAKASLAVVRGKTEQKDVMKIEPLNGTNEDDQVVPKPIYAMASVHWGAYRDVLTLRDKYWYFGPMREYGAFLFNAFSNALTWNCEAKLIYSSPCQGCSNCYIKPHETAQKPGRWWSSFMPKSKPAPLGPDYSKVQNANCKQTATIDVRPSELLLSTNAHRDANEIPKIKIQFGKDEESGMDFVLESWSRIRNEEFKPSMEMNVRSVEIIPEKLYSEDNEIFFSIDNEAYEVKPVKVSILPGALKLYII